MRIYKAINKVPGGLMVVPLFIGMALNTFCKRELNCTFPDAVASTRLGCATRMASGED